MVFIRLATSQAEVMSQLPYKHSNFLPAYTDWILAIVRLKVETQTA